MKPQQIKVKLLDTSLINRFGVTPVVPYLWGMQRIKEGLAEIYAPPQEFKPKNSLPFNGLPQNDVILYTHLTKKLQHGIVWVQDNNILGGAELSNQLVISVGGTLGFNIHVLTPQNFSLHILRNAKLIILNNIMTFNPTQMVEIKRAIFEFQVPYIKYEHDMRGLREKDLGLSRQLFKHSKFNMFISPLQEKTYKEKVYDVSVNHILPLAIDVDKFKPNPKIKRIKNKAVHTSGSLHNKGAATVFSMVNQRQDLQFELFVGDNNTVAKLFANCDNVTIRGRVSNDEMPDVYSSAQYLVHLPTEVWAGERVVLEAALCGCEIITNDNVGHASWGWDFKDVDALRETLKKAPYEFWHKVEEIL